MLLYFVDETPIQLHEVRVQFACDFISLDETPVHRGGAWNQLVGS